MDFRLLNNTGDSHRSCDNCLAQKSIPPTKPIHYPKKGGKCVGRLLAGGQVGASRSRQESTLLEVFCMLIVVWVCGLWVYGCFIQTVNFIVCRFYLSQANNRKKTPSSQAPGSRSATSVSLSDENHPSFSLLRLPARLPRQ